MSQTETDNLPFVTPEIKVAHSAASLAGDILKKHFANLGDVSLSHDQKESWDLLTVADVEAERAIIDCIKKEFPDHGCLAEESSGETTDDHEHEKLWVIDPLDGTNNFAHGIPHFAVSIAYYKDSEPVLGVIYNPISNDWYIAGQGRGAWHNGTKVQVNNHRNLKETMIGVGFYYDRGEMMKSTLNAISQLFEQEIHGIRRMGTAALDLAQVGLGCFGGYFEYKLKPWDFAAGRLFVEEAGGKVTDCSGQPLKLQPSTILATNRLLHPPILEIVERHIRNPST